MSQKLSDTNSRSEFCGRLLRLAKPFFFSEARYQAWGLLLLLLILLTSIKAFDVAISFINNRFFSALQKQNGDEFIYQLSLYLGAFAIAVPLAAFYRFCEERMALAWRNWMSREMIKHYLSQRIFYRLGWVRGIDNPDQRLEEDVRSFTAQSLSLFLVFLQSLIAIVAFTSVLAKISILLPLVALVYAIVGSIGTYLLGKPLIGLHFEQLKKDADYRYKLIKIRDNAESIALYNSESKEATRIRQRLRDAIKNMALMIHRNLKLNFFTNGYNNIAIILPTVVIAPAFFRGELQLGDITQAGIAFGNVLNALSVIILNFGSLSSYAAVVKRLGAFQDAFSELEKHTPSNGQKQITLKKCNEVADDKEKNFEFVNLTLLTPNRGRALIKDLSLVLERQRTLILGGSGHGKSAIFRAIAGLWSSGSGTIIHPPYSKVSFVPQRPYLTIGTLRSQILYGQPRKSFLDYELLKIVEAVDLKEMYQRVGGFDALVDWATTLSIGEQQQIGIARLILAQNSYALLDESTTALDEICEERCYNLIRKQCHTILSVGNRPKLRQHHNLLLELTGSGSFKIEKI
jgi:putative ATP-binding cassette transporter